MPGILPDRIVLRMLRIGVQALVSNPDILDDIWATIESETERAKAKAFFLSNPPSLVQGYPRMDVPFPLVCVFMLADNDQQEFLAEAEQYVETLGDDGDAPGFTRERRRTETIGVLTVTTTPDLCSLLYRVVKRIVEVGTPHMIARGLDLPRLAGQELAPDQQTNSEQLFRRQLSITVEYEDEWPVGDALWEALNGEQEPFTIDPDKVDTYGADVSFEDEDGDQFGGTVTTFDPEDEDAEEE